MISYRIKDRIINIKNVDYVQKEDFEEQSTIYFYMNRGSSFTLSFKTREERDKEFNIIEELMDKDLVVSMPYGINTYPQC